MKSCLFSVGLVFRPELKNHPQWVVTCDRCGVDLSADFRSDPVTLISPKVPLQPSAMTNFHLAVRKAWKHARDSGDPITHNDDLDVEQVSALDLQRVLAAHAKLCAA